MIELRDKILKIKWRQLFVIIVLGFCISCTQNNPTQYNSIIKSDTLKPPVIVIAEAPVVTMLDTCPPPRKVIIPTRPGKYAIRKSRTGPQMIQLVPPEKRPLNFIAALQNYNTEQGLAVSSLFGSCADKKGNIWFGTNGGGVSRYDGKSFVNYTVTHGLAANAVPCIYEDKMGNIWFSTFGGGVSCYDGKTFTNYAMVDGIVDNFVYGICEDKKGNLWFGTAGGVSMLDRITKTFYNYTTAQGLADNRVYFISADRSGKIWAGTSIGASRFNDEGKSFSSFKPIVNNAVMNVFEDKKGNIWFGTYAGVIRLDAADRSLPESNIDLQKFTTAQGLAGGIVGNIVEDKEGNIWFGTEAGVSMLHHSLTGKSSDEVSFTNYTTEQGLTSNLIYSILEDNNGNIWFNTFGGGVLKLNHAGKALLSYTSAQGIADDMVFNIKEDRYKNIWFGTNRGLSMLDAGGKFVTNYTTAQGLVDYRVLSILEDKQGNIWFSTEGDGISRLDTAKKTITTYTTTQGLVHNIISTMLEDKSGNIWFGTQGDGISYYNGTSFTNYTTENGLADNYVNDILEDKSGKIWFSTANGISCFTPKLLSQGGATFTNYTASQGLLNNAIYSSLEDKAGNIWFGSNGGGLSRFDGKSFINYTSANGLSDDVVYDIVMDKQGFIWAGTNKGFTVLKGFDPNLKHSTGSGFEVIVPASNKLSNNELKNAAHTPVFEIYNNSTGYQIKDVNVSAMCITVDGYLWAGTGEKLVKFDYSAIHKNPAPPNVFIQNVKIDNENISWHGLKTTEHSKTANANIIEEATLFSRPLSEEQHDTMYKKFGDIKFDSITDFYPVPINLVLPYNHNNITFDFAAIEPARPYMVRYTHMLTGYDKDWSPAGNTTTATFGNIQEGTYTFKLKAQSPDGVWSKPLLYTFKVLPPWYRSWWAFALYALVFSLAVWSFIRWRLKVLKKEKARLEEKLLMQDAVMLERTRISRELHDEVGATLSGIAMYSHLTKEQIKQSNITEVEKSLNIMQQSAGEMVNKLNDIVWLVNPDHDSLQKLIQRLEEYARDMAAIKNMQVKVTVPEHLQEHSLPVESRRNIYLFCKEAINNAVKYSNASLLELNIKEVDHRLEFSVSDNGKGFDSVMVRRGNGLENMQRRADEIGAKLTLQSKKDEGSLVSMQIKITH